MSLPKDDLVRILKEVCSSSRYLLDNAKANNLKAPYQVTKGKILTLQCSAQAAPPAPPPPPPACVTTDSACDATGKTCNNGFPGGRRGFFVFVY